MRKIRTFPAFQSPMRWSHVTTTGADGSVPRSAFIPGRQYGCSHLGRHHRRRDHRRHKTVSATLTTSRRKSLGASALKAFLSGLNPDRGFGEPLLSRMPRGVSRRSDCEYTLIVRKNGLSKSTSGISSPAIFRRGSSPSEEPVTLRRGHASSFRPFHTSAFGAGPRRLAGGISPRSHRKHIQILRLTDFRVNEKSRSCHQM